MMRFGAVLLLATASYASEPQCVFRTAEAVYDLRSLKDRVYTVPSPSRYFDYSVTVCGNVDPQKAHQSCQGIAQTHPAPMLYHSNDGFCYWIGNAMEPYAQGYDGSPYYGFDLVYKDGQQCSDGRPREMRVHFVCSPYYGVDEGPKYVTETPERCHYNITWPTYAACPRSSWTSFHVFEPDASRGFFEFLWDVGNFAFFWVSVVAMAYCVGGCCFLHHAHGRRLGYEAMPHREFWTPHLQRGLAYIPSAAQSMGFPVPVQARTGGGGSGGPGGLEDDDLGIGKLPTRTGGGGGGGGGGGSGGGRGNTMGGAFGAGARPGVAYGGGTMPSFTGSAGPSGNGGAAPRSDQGAFAGEEEEEDDDLDAFADPLDQRQGGGGRGPSSQTTGRRR